MCPQQILARPRTPRCSLPRVRRQRGESASAYHLHTSEENTHLSKTTKKKPERFRPITPPAYRRKLRYQLPRAGPAAARPVPAATPTTRARPALPCPAPPGPFDPSPAPCIPPALTRALPAPRAAAGGAISVAPALRKRPHGAPLPACPR